MTFTSFTERMSNTKLLTPQCDFLISTRTVKISTMKSLWGQSETLLITKSLQCGCYCQISDNQLITFETSAVLKTNYEDTDLQQYPTPYSRKVRTLLQPNKTVRWKKNLSFHCSQKQDPRKANPTRRVHTTPNIASSAPNYAITCAPFNTNG